MKASKRAAIYQSIACMSVRLADLACVANASVMFSVRNLLAPTFAQPKSRNLFMLACIGGA